jgi:bacterioferritin-associated ferredoxin
MVSAALAFTMLFGLRAMNLDDKVCYCFHVSRRKLVNWVRLNCPKVPSQLSDCGGAGTGCGWCIPFLKQIFRQGTGQQGGGSEPLTYILIDEVTSEDYAAQRADYVKSGKGTPPPGAEPLPPVGENQGLEKAQEPAQHHEN